MTDPTPVPSYVRTPQAGFLASLAVDRTLARYDLAGSVAHAEMLGHVGLLSPAELTTLKGGLRAIGREIAAGSFPWREELEDIHTNIEVRLTALVGPVGGKIHTARSRNDQVALDERLYLRAAVARVAAALVLLEELLVAKASAEATFPMPGYTHLQRAQPVTVGHLLLAHFWRFDRDLDRLLATAQRSNVSPLGAGALAGSTLPIDPAFTADRLGFDRAFENSMDAVSDRDPFAELLFDLALLAVHASALGEEVVLFATKEFGFLERTPGLGSGSSLMPQKRNPDAAELVRGKAGRVIGDLVSLLTTLKGLPLTYDRDLQEDKPPVFDAVETLLGVLDALATIVSTMVFDHARLRAAAEDPELFATDIAERSVAEGVPFRSAHESVVALYSNAPGSTSSSDNPDNPDGPPTLTPDLSRMLEPTSALERRASPGGPAPREVERQLTSARTRLVARVASLSSLDRKVALTEELLEEEQK
jgi:argininosuccinate lyase